jgi:hypothetical protein
LVVYAFCLFSSGSNATFFWNSFSARAQTSAFRQSLSCLRYGNRSPLKASELSLGSSDGKWSIEITLNGGALPTSTATVGAVNVVLIV